MICEGFEHNLARLEAAKLTDCDHVRAVCGVDKGYTVMSALEKDHKIFRQNPRLRKDHRRHRRVRMKLHGRFLNHESEEHGLVTDNISVGGAYLKSAAIPPMDAQIVCYFEHLGRIVGDVVRIDDDGFAIKFKVSQIKRDRLADKIIWLVNKDRLGLVEERGAQRFAAEGPALILRQDGTTLQCRVIDISLSGAGLEADGPLPMIGETIQVGNIKAEVVRVNANGFGVRFNKKQEHS